jgi:PPOX class probable F420-dependent enzyme
MSESAQSTTHPSTANEPADGICQFLERQLYLTLATLNPDGSLHVVPLLYLFAEGRFYVATSSSTRKARNLAARPDVTVTIDDRTTIEWVSAVGTAELIRGQRSREINRRLYSLWMTPEGVAVVGHLLQEGMPSEQGTYVEDVTIEITPTRWSAWDMTSQFLVPLRQAGVPLDDLGRWFLS